MTTFGLQWAADALREEGLLLRAEPGDAKDSEWRGATIDSRGECSRRLFFAIVAERDGHDFIEDAVRNGAEGVVVSKGEAFASELARRHPIAVLAVPDTVEALQLLGRRRLEDIGARTIGVTGTNGKTTTKDYVKAVVATRYRVSGTEGNFNNQLGVPLTLLSLAGDEDWIVLELGATSAGDIDLLASWTKPEIGIITNIGAGHLQTFGSLDEIAHVKGELLDRISPEGLSILPADDRFLPPLRKRSPAPVLTFGFDETADIRIESARTTSAGTRCRIQGHDLLLKKWGRHNALNAAAAICVARRLAISDREAAAALEEADGSGGRSRLLDIDGIILVDDTYNANPSSMTRALEALGEMPVSGRRWALLGDMLELGEEAEELHRRVGASAAESNIDFLLAVGEFAQAYCAGAASVEPSALECSVFEAPGRMAEAVGVHVRKGDALLLKGSRGSTMENVLELIVAHLAGGYESCSTT